MLDQLFAWAEDHPGRAIAATILAALLGLSSFFYVCYRGDRIICRRLGEAANVRTKYDFIAGGCFVRLNGRWIPATAWRGIE